MSHVGEFDYVIINDDLQSLVDLFTALGRAYKRTIVSCNANFVHRNLSERSFQVTEYMPLHEGYVFEHSAALVDGRFLGLMIDQRTQGMLTDERMDKWLAQVLPLLQEKLRAA